MRYLSTYSFYLSMLRANVLRAFTVCLSVGTCLGFYPYFSAQYNGINFAVYVANANQFGGRLESCDTVCPWVYSSFTPQCRPNVPSTITSASKCQDLLRLLSNGRFDLFAGGVTCAIQPNPNPYTIRDYTGAKQTISQPSIFGNCTGSGCSINSLVMYYPSPGN